MYTRIFLFLLLLFPIHGAVGQPLLAVEARLIRSYQQIGVWKMRVDSGFSDSGYDSLQLANEQFERLLQNELVSRPATLHCPFVRLQQAGVTVLTSSDGRFRVYNWDRQTGGTMHYFGTVLQCASGSRVVCRSLPAADDQEDPGFGYSNLFVLQHQGPRYYLLIATGIYSTKDMHDEVQVFKLNVQGQIDTANIILTASGLHGTLGFDYDFFSVYTRPERPLQLIRYDSPSRRITIPVALPDGTVTDRLITYQFDGRVFKKQKADR